MATGTVVTNSGKAKIAACVVADGAWKYAGWGTGNSQPVTADALATAAAPTTATNVTGTVTNTTTTVTNDTIHVDATITAGGTLTITEAGIFNQATESGQKMLWYSDALSQLVNSGDSINLLADTKIG